jgi:hypothetical protein
VSGAFAYPPPDLQRLAASHRQLMSLYAAALEASSKPGWRRSLSNRAIVELLVSLHARAKLRALSADYTQIAAALDERSKHAEKAWLERAASECKALVDTLPRIPVPSLKWSSFVAVGAAVWAYVGGLAKTSTWGGSSAVIAYLATYCGLLLIIGWVCVRSSFLDKREVMLGWHWHDPVERSGSHRARTSPADVYAGEETLFGLLRRHNGGEPRLDLWLEGFPIVAIGLFLFVDPFRWTKGVTFWTQIVPASLAAIALLVWASTLSGRTPPKTRAFGDKAGG